MWDFFLQKLISLVLFCATPLLLFKSKNENQIKEIKLKKNLYVLVLEISVQITDAQTWIFQFSAITAI